MRIGQKRIIRVETDMIKVMNIASVLAAIGYLIAVVSLIILLICTITGQVAPLGYELSLLVGVFTFIGCTGLAIFISNIEQSYYV